jgi:hypothetical protein
VGARGGRAGSGAPPGGSLRSWNVRRHEPNPPVCALLLEGGLRRGAQARPAGQGDEVGYSDLTIGYF